MHTVLRLLQHLTSWLLTLFLFFFSAISYAQEYRFSKPISGDSIEIVNHISTDKSGNLLMIGYFTDTCDFDPSGNTQNRISRRRNDTYFAKYNRFGQYQWVRNIKSYGSLDQGMSIDVDNNNNIYISGTLEGFAEFDEFNFNNSLNTRGGTDIFVVKYDSNGLFRWGFTLGNVHNDYGRDLKIGPDGHIYITGIFVNVVDFNPGADTNHLVTWPSLTENMFLAKYDTAGNYMWAGNITASDRSNGQKLALNIPGKVMVTGWFGGTADFDIDTGYYNLSSVGNPTSLRDIYLAQYDTSGKLQWVHRFGDTGHDYSKGLIIDSKNNIYLGGEFRATVDFDAGSGTANLSAVKGVNSDVFIAKYRSNGQYVWAKRFGDTGITLSGDLRLDRDGNVFVTGAFGNTCDFDPGNATLNKTSNGAYDAFLSKLDSNGNLLWNRTFGGKGDEIGISVATDRFANVYAAGIFNDTVVFNQGGNISDTLIGKGYGDIFFTQYNECIEPTKPIASISTDTICKGDSLVLRVIGGSLNGAEDWYWYTGGCGVRFAGKGSQITVIADSTRNYFVLGGGGCATADTCDTVGVYVRPSFTLNRTFTICDNKTMFLGGQNRFVPGTYYDSFKTYQGCDSIVATRLNHNPTFNTELDIDICDNDSIFLQKAWRRTTNSYYDTFPSQLGCDSFVKVNLTVNPTYLITRNVAICGGESIFLGGAFQFFEGDYYDTFATIHGCDSIIMTSLSINPTYVTPINLTICGGDSILIFNKYRKAAGNYYDTLHTKLGCDSIIEARLNVLPFYVRTVPVAICDNDSIRIAGVFRKQPGQYWDSLRTRQGCDSFVLVSLTTRPTFFFNRSYILCEGQGILVGGQVINKVGSYLEKMKTAFGCDSIIQHNITKLNPSYSIITPINSCNPITIDGITYTNSTTLTKGFKTNLGCDSLLITQLNIGRSYNQFGSAVICQGDSFLVHGIWRKTSGQYIETFKTAIGCDSTVTFFVEVRSAYNENRQFFLCKNDSLATGFGYIKDPGLYNQKFFSSQGCDSVVNFSVSLYKVETGVTKLNNNTLMANVVDQKYQWLNCGLNYNLLLGANGREFNPPFRGSFAVEVTQNSCVDTSACIQMLNVSAENIEKVNAITYYPVPVTGLLTVELSSLQKELSFSVYELNGKKVNEGTQRNTKVFEIDMANLASGIYYVKILSASENQVLRVVKQ